MARWRRWWYEFDLYNFKVYCSYCTSKKSKATSGGWVIKTNAVRLWEVLKKRKITDPFTYHGLINSLNQKKFTTASLIILISTFIYIYIWLNPNKLKNINILWSDPFFSTLSSSMNQVGVMLITDFLYNRLATGPIRLIILSIRDASFRTTKQNPERGLLNPDSIYIFPTTVYYTPNI